jgi:hypothetical protein
MTGDERIALLLAARLLECGVTLESPELGGEGGHVNVALNLTDRLRRVAHDPDDAREIIAALRSAAEEPAEV